MPRVVAFVPARRGSVRIPGKNRQLVGSTPLWMHAVLHAAQAGLRPAYLSTDDPAIQEQAGDLGPDVVRVLCRPARLADTCALVWDAVRHHLEAGELGDPGWICLLNPTSPLRRPATIRRCVMAAMESGRMAVSVVRRPARFTWTSTGEPVGSWPRPRTQDQPVELVEVGVCYVVHADAVLGRRPWGRAVPVEVGPREAIDIDELVDLEMARSLYRLRGEEEHAERSADSSRDP